jgi:hypothetical protein
MSTDVVRWWSDIILFKNVIIFMIIPSSRDGLSINMRERGHTARRSAFDFALSACNFDTVTCNCCNSSVRFSVSLSLVFVHIFILLLRGFERTMFGYGINVRSNPSPPVVT